MNTLLNTPNGIIVKIVSFSLSQRMQSRLLSVLKISFIFNDFYIFIYS